MSSNPQFANQPGYDGDGFPIRGKSSVEIIDRYLEFSQSAIGPTVNDVIWESPDLLGYSVHTFYVTTGTLRLNVDMHADGTWSGSMAARNAGSTSSSTQKVVDLSGFGIYVFMGNFKKIRLIANDITDVSCRSIHTNGQHYE